MIEQVGGTHYGQGDLPQHWDLVAMYGWDYFDGQAIKYIMRWKRKNGTEDLRKAISFIQKQVEITEGGAEPRLNPVVYDFEADIVRFNRMYSLPESDVPRLLLRTEMATHRLDAFEKNLLDEISEKKEIMSMLVSGADPADTLTAIADWFGDIIIWTASEMRKFGIPLNDTLRLIMESQWSKLGADGKPILKDGRVVKGPNYKKPEPAIRKMLLDNGAPTVRGTSDVIARFEPPQNVADGWQCEGYYGDNTQLYRHLDSGMLFREVNVLQAVSSYAATQPGPGYTSQG